MKQFDEAFRYLSSGRHAALLGSGSCPLPEDLRTVVVDCASSHPVLEHARNLADRFLQGGARMRPVHRLGRDRMGLRRHLIGEELGRVALVPYFEAFERLTAREAPPTILVLFNVDLADVASLHGLIALLDAQALSVPTLFCFEERPSAGPATELFEAVVRSQGPDAIFELETTSGQRAPQAHEGWRNLPLSATRSMLLRAAATMGPNFESGPLGELLGISELDVLRGLQEASDAGLPIEDRGRGRFRMPPDVATELASQVLPSLASAWHQRLAELFGGGPGESGKSKPEPPAASAPAAPAPAPERSLPAGRLADDLLVSQPLDRPQSVPEERDWHEALAHWTPEQGPPDGLDEPFDEWRAADHAKRAGNLELAAEKYAQAAERAARAGSHVVASDYAERALAVLRDVPDNERTRRVMVAALMSLGRARWQGAGSDDGASLSAALQSLDECKELLDDSAPAALRAELGSLIAEVCYDMGSPRALERALDELTASGKQLLEANQPLEAARLLNDEAAVWVQIGDPVRAHYLLSRSREVFRHVLSSYAPAARELAQTEHMLARLLLHAKPRPGRAQDALKLGIEHAKNAEQAYHDFKDQRCEARVWETLGRLEMRAGHPDRAAAHLEDAIRAQEQLGDHVGLARSTGALAELLHTRGESARALQTLSDSIQQNLSTGSRGGLRFNLKGLRALAADLPDDLAATGRELEQELLKRLGGS